MERLLYISYFGFEDKNANSIQCARLLASLKNHYDVTPIFRSSKSITSDDAIGIKSPNISLLDKFLYKLLPSLTHVFSFDKMLWVLFVYQFLKVNTYKFDQVIISYSPFQISTLGNLLKNKFHVHYISQFLDPLSDNYYWALNEKTRNRLQNLEKNICINSDTIFLYSNQLIHRFRSRYSNAITNKIVITRFCTDPNITITSTEKNEKITIIHAGNLYGQRNLTELINTIRVLEYKFKDLSALLEIRLYGNVYDNIGSSVNKLNLGHIIKFYPSLSKQELYCQLAKADAFLCIDGLNQDNVFFPSKLCEYLSFNKIIFGITPEVSETRDVLIEAGHYAFAKGEHERFSAEISKLLLDRNYFANRIDKTYFMKFLPDNVASKITINMCDMRKHVSHL